MYYFSVVPNSVAKVWRQSRSTTHVTMATRQPMTLRVVTFQEVVVSNLPVSCCIASHVSALFSTNGKLYSHKNILLLPSWLLLKFALRKLENGNFTPKSTCLFCQGQLAAKLKDLAVTAGSFQWSSVSFPVLSRLNWITIRISILRIYSHNIMPASEKACPVVSLHI